MKEFKLFFFLILLSFVLSCKINKVQKTHGVNNLIEKTKLIIVNSTNKNDVINLLGPSIILDNNGMKYSYFEVVETKNKLGKRIIYINDYVEINFDKYGIVKKINTYNLKNNNDLSFSKQTTDTLAVKDTILKNLLDSTRKRMEQARKKYQKN